MTDVRLNFYPRVTRTVLFGGKPRVVTVQFAGYSLGGGPLVADVGEAQELGFPVTSRRVTLDLTRADLKTDSDVVAALNLGRGGCEEKNRRRRKRVVVRAKHLLLVGIAAGIVGLVACLHGLATTHDSDAFFLTLFGVNLAAALGSAYYYKTQP